MTLPEEVFAELVSKWPVARFATVSAQGQPHCVPIVFCEHDGALYSPLDGKRKSGERLRRIANLAENPNATLLLDEYGADWQSLWWVRIDGKADWFEPGTATAEAITSCLLQKYPQYSDRSLMFDTHAFLRLRPINVVAWAQSDTAATINAAVRWSDSLR